MKPLKPVLSLVSLAGLALLARAEVIERVIVRVNGDIVTQSEFESRQVAAVQAARVPPAEIEKFLRENNAKIQDLNAVLEKIQGKEDKDNVDLGLTDAEVSLLSSYGIKTDDYISKENGKNTVKADNQLSLLREAISNQVKSMSSNDQLDMIGFGQYPGGLDPHIPFIAIIWWTNREFIHHMSEIALLRDLWAHR